MPDDKTSDADFSDVTTDSSIRWTGLGSAIALSIILTYLGLSVAMAVGWAEPLPDQWFTVLKWAVSAVLGWTLGLDGIREFRNGKSDS